MFNMNVFFFFFFNFNMTRHYNRPFVDLLKYDRRGHTSLSGYGPLEANLIPLKRGR